MSLNDEPEVEMRFGESITKMSDDENKATKSEKMMEMIKRHLLKHRHPLAQMIACFRFMFMQGHKSDVKPSESQN